MRNKIDPNNFFSKQNISLEEAAAAQRIIPPWRQKLINDLKGNKNSSAMFVPGVHKEPVEVLEEQILKRKNPRRWLNILVVPIVLIHWGVVLFQNVIDVVSDGIHEIILALENFISNAQTEPDRVPPSN